MLTGIVRRRVPLPVRQLPGVDKRVTRKKIAKQAEFLNQSLDDNKNQRPLRSLHNSFILFPQPHPICSQPRSCPSSTLSNSCLNTSPCSTQLSPNFVYLLYSLQPLVLLSLPNQRPSYLLVCFCLFSLGFNSPTTTSFTFHTPFFSSFGTSFTLTSYTNFFGLSFILKSR